MMTAAGVGLLRSSTTMAAEPLPRASCEIGAVPIGRWKAARIFAAAGGSEEVLQRALVHAGGLPVGGQDPI